MKKNYLLFLFALLFAANTFAQVNILFVNDNAVNVENTTTILAALDQTGYLYEVFDAEVEGRSPNYLEMSNYNVIIWYMSSDGVGNYFWNGDDTDNENIKLYLQNGGAMWVIGTDFLYDRFATPFIFEMGEFVYDYLGVWEYHAQSYADDGTLGVPQLDLSPDQFVTDLDPVLWVFSTLWYVDAVVPANDAISVYNMGPDTYVFSEYSAAVLTVNNYNTLSYFFDPALVDTEANRVKMMQDGLDYFSIIQNTSELERKAFSVYPNPADNITSILLEEGINGQMSVFSLNGKLLDQFDLVKGEQMIQLDLTTYRPGIYFLQIGQTVRKLIVTK